VRIVSQTHRTPPAELNAHLEASVSTETARRELHKSNSHGRAATATPLITEKVMLRCVKAGVTTIKPGHLETQM
jgi:hypothetical protein